MKPKRLVKLKEIVASSYELTAQHFNETRSKVAAPDFVWAVNQIGSDDQVLDAGCGNGRLLDYIKLRPEQYLGLDQSSSLLAYARDKHPGYNFIKADLSAVEALIREKFSLIFCSAVISHIPGRKERREVLRSLLAATLPEGRLIISFWKLEGRNRRKLYLTWWKKMTGRHPYGWRDLIFPWKNARGEEISPRYYYAFTKRYFCRELRRAGWRIESVRNDRFNYWVIARPK